MKNNNFVLFIFLLLYSCSENSSTTIIKGKITNLPDGVLYLYKDASSNIIDSVYTKNGQFNLKHNWHVEANEPFYLGLDHKDRKGVLRAFYFSTDSKFKNSEYNSQFFFSDSIISISGTIKEFITKDFKLSEKIKIVTIPKVKAGYQTKALFNINGDLFSEIDKYTFEKVTSKITEYPNSFHLLYQINNNKNSFTAHETQKMLNLFKGKITNSQTYKSLNEYNIKRLGKNKLVLPKLTDSSGNKTDILDAKFKKHLVVFWASWCEPCRQEIPALKNMYSKYKDEVEFVSISTDENNSSWQKALEKEDMTWRQFIVSEKSKEYEPVEIFFQLSTSIPYVALVDNNMKVIKSHVGLMTESEMERFFKNN